MTTLLSRLFARPRAFCADCQEGQGRGCKCRKREPLPTSPATFWWAYALLIWAVVALVHAVRALT